ncbi:MAG: Rpn family recombination-promoting nuclease/putative transposase [Desulfobacterales bacterium]|nr:Rpn family recombination-promoting nuclease/putative transposase [Desulfobacterales bacterium]MBF0398030.1 Rpn family recombination-promoting nuclease/putative transposase [Desulfobacterales bacterium]
MSFLDVKTDFAFKKVFGSDQSKDILIDFLNSVIIFPENTYIEDLTIVDPYNIPLLKGMKDTYVDVKAKLENGTTVIIEMQVLNYEGFEKRILYNAAKNYSTQLMKGEEYQLLNPVIALTITDFNMFDFDNIISYFRLLEKTKFVEYSGGDIELIFIELPKFIKTEEELVNISDKWIYFLKNAGRLEYIPKSLEIDKNIKKAFEIANEARLTPEELEMQHKRKDFIYIQKNALIYAEKKAMQKGLNEGFKEGIEKGKAIGLEEGTKNIARNMLKIGFSIKQITEATGLKEEEICDS